jgi:hypothetical protein
MAGEGLVIYIIFPLFCCYSFPSLAEGTWRKTLPHLSSADKNEIPCVKKQSSKPGNGKHLQLSKDDFACIGLRIIRRLFWQILIFFMRMKIFREESFNFFSYNEEYLVCRREIYLPFDNNIELQSILKQNLPVHPLTFFLRCSCMSHSYINVPLPIRLLRCFFPLKILYVFLISPYLVHVSHSGF